MRILVLASTFPRWTGDSVPPFVQLLSDAMAQRGHEVHVLAPHVQNAALEEDMDDVTVHRFRYAPGPLASLAYGGGMLENLRGHPWRWGLVLPFLLAQTLTLARLHRTYRFDAVHAHWVVPQGLVAVLARPLLRCPIVVTAHGGDVFAMRRGVRRRIAAFVLRRADTATAVSTALRGAIERMSGTDAVVIPMGVDTSAFDVPSAISAPRGRGSPTVLFVGRLVEKKGVRHLLLAMPRILQAVPSAGLLVIGDGPEREPLERLAAELGIRDSVEFRGATSNTDLPSVYRVADVFVAPSKLSREGDTEGMPVVLLEAAASGVPVVASRVGGIPDLIRHGETGLLVEPEDETEIASAIVQLLQDDVLRERLAGSARQLVSAEFSWPSVADRYEQVFRSVVPEGRGSG